MLALSRSCIRTSASRHNMHTFACNSRLPHHHDVTVNQTSHRRGLRLYALRAICRKGHARLGGVCSLVLPRSRPRDAIKYLWQCQALWEARSCSKSAADASFSKWPEARDLRWAHVTPHVVS